MHRWLALAGWAGTAQIVVQRVEQLDMAEAVAVLGASEEPITELRHDDRRAG